MFKKWLVTLAVFSFATSMTVVANTNVDSNSSLLLTTEFVSQVKCDVAAPTFSQPQALKSAKRYLDIMGFSYNGLINQLSSEYGDNFSIEDATYAADHCGADWNAQALKSANKYLSLSMGFSYKGLINQLSSEYGDKFTVEQATYAADNCGADWKEEAVKAANNYINAGLSMSRSGMITQLTSEYGDRFTQAEAEYAVQKIGY